MSPTSSKLTKWQWVGYVWKLVTGVWWGWRDSPTPGGTGAYCFTRDKAGRWGGHMHSLEVNKRGRTCDGGGAHAAVDV
jgi:hypothetical protein